MRPRASPPGTRANSEGTATPGSALSGSDDSDAGQTQGASRVQGPGPRVRGAAAAAHTCLVPPSPAVTAAPGSFLLGHVQTGFFAVKVRTEGPSPSRCAPGLLPPGPCSSQAEPGLAALLLPARPGPGLAQFLSSSGQGAESASPPGSSIYEVSVLLSDCVLSHECG